MTTRIAAQVCHAGRERCRYRWILILCVVAVGPACKPADPSTPQTKGAARSQAEQTASDPRAAVTEFFKALARNDMAAARSWVIAESLYDDLIWALADFQSAATKLRAAAVARFGDAASDMPIPGEWTVGSARWAKATGPVSRNASMPLPPDSPSSHLDLTQGEDGTWKVDLTRTERTQSISGRADGVAAMARAARRVLREIEAGKYRTMGELAEATQQIRHGLSQGWGAGTAGDPEADAVRAASVKFTQAGVSDPETVPRLVVGTESRLRYCVSLARANVARLRFGRAFAKLRGAPPPGSEMARIANRFERARVQLGVRRASCKSSDGEEVVLKLVEGQWKVDVDKTGPRNFREGDTAYEEDVATQLTRLCDDIDSGRTTDMDEVMRRASATRYNPRSTRPTSQP